MPNLPVTLTIREDRIDIAVEAMLHHVGRGDVWTNPNLTVAQKREYGRQAMVKVLNGAVSEYERAKAAANDTTFS